MPRIIVLVSLATLVLAGSRTFGVEGGLYLTGRGLVAVPQKDHRVFLSWRFLQQDGPAATFEVQRSGTAEPSFVAVGVARDTTTFMDAPEAGVYSCRVAASGQVLTRAECEANVESQLEEEKGSGFGYWCPGGIHDNQREHYRITRRHRARATAPG